jgi:hypothetical protein
MDFYLYICTYRCAFGLLGPVPMWGRCGPRAHMGPGPYCCSRFGRFGIAVGSAGIAPSPCLASTPSCCLRCAFFPQQMETEAQNKSKTKPYKIKQERTHNGSVGRCGFIMRAGIVVVLWWCCVCFFVYVLCWFAVSVPVCIHVVFVFLSIPSPGPMLSPLP